MFLARFHSPHSPGRPTLAHTRPEKRWKWCKVLIRKILRYSGPRPHFLQFPPCALSLNTNIKFKYQKYATLFDLNWYWYLQDYTWHTQRRAFKYLLTSSLVNIFNFVAPKLYDHFFNFQFVPPYLSLAEWLPKDMKKNNYYKVKCMLYFFRKNKYGNSGKLKESTPAQNCWVSA